MACSSPSPSPTQTADTDSAWRVRDTALALAASDSGSYFLAEHFHIHKAELRHLHRQLQPPAPPSTPPSPPSSLSSFSLSQLDFQHFYASKMLRCLLKMLAAVWGRGSSERERAEIARWRHILLLSLSLSLLLSLLPLLHVSIEMSVARRPAVHPPLDASSLHFAITSHPATSLPPSTPTTQRSLNLATTILCMTNLCRRSRR